MNSAFREELNNIHSNGFRDGFNMGLRDGCLGGLWVEDDGLGLRTEEMDSRSESVEDEGEDILVSGFRGLLDKVSREAKSCSPSADPFSPSSPCLSLGASELSPLEILMDQLRKFNLSVLDNRVGHLNVSGGGLIKTSYLAREALDEMSEEIAEFRAHLPSLHNRY